MQYTPIVGLNVGNRAQAPIFCVPGAAASASIYLELAEAIDSKVTLYSLEPRGLDGQTEPHRSIEAAACDYLQAMMTVQPRGPYRLLGHSFGGWVSFEMSLQLQAKNLPVEEVWLIDSDVPIGDQAQPWDLMATLQELVKMFEMRFQRPLRAPPALFDGQTLAQAACTLRERLVDAEMLHRKVSVRLLAACLHVFQVNLSTGYLPATSFNGTVHLLNAEMTDDDLRAREHGWRTYAPGVTTASVPGNHMSILRQPGVQSIGDHLGQQNGRMHTASSAAFKGVA